MGRAVAVASAGFVEQIQRTGVPDLDTDALEPRSLGSFPRRSLRRLLSDLHRPATIPNARGVRPICCVRRLARFYRGRGLGRLGFLRATAGGRFVPLRPEPRMVAGQISPIRPTDPTTHAS